MVPDPKTEELRVEQVQRESAERRRAEVATEDDEAQQHARRAERAAYLQEKLTQRAAAEDAADPD